MITIIGTEYQIQWEMPRLVITAEPDTRVIRLTSHFLVKNHQDDMIKVAMTPPMPMQTSIAVPTPGPAPRASEV